MLRCKVPCSRLVCAGKKGRKGGMRSLEELWVLALSDPTTSQWTWLLWVQRQHCGLVAKSWVCISELLCQRFPAQPAGCKKWGVLKCRSCCAAMPKLCPKMYLWFSSLFVIWAVIVGTAVCVHQGSRNIRGSPLCPHRGRWSTDLVLRAQGGLSWQESHRNGHWQKEDVRHHGIESWWCRNLCYPIKAHEPHRGLHATGSYHCPFHPVFCSFEEVLVNWLIFCSQLLFLCCIRMKWLKCVCKPEMLIVRNRIIISFGKLIRSLN